jgi:hypothetical protein
MLRSMVNPVSTMLHFLSKELWTRFFYGHSNSFISHAYMTWFWFGSVILVFAKLICVIHEMQLMIEVLELGRERNWCLWPITPPSQGSSMERSLSHWVLMWLR